MFKRLCGVVIALAGTLQMAEGAVPLDRVLAVVNDEIVTQYDLSRFSKQNLGGQTAASAGEDRLTQLVDRRLLLQEAEKRGVGISDEELERAIGDIVARNNFQSAAALEAAISHGKKEIWEEHRKGIREELTVLKLMSLTLEETAVEEAVARAYYDAHPSEFSDLDAIRLQQLFFPLATDAPEAEVGRVHEKALRALAEAETGTDFNLLIQKYREGEALSQQSDLGVFKRGDLAPEIDAMIFGLGTGEVSPLVRSHLGFHLFKISDRTPAQPKSFEESRERIDETILAQKRNVAYQKWLSELRKRAFVEMTGS